jgi:glycosyltransferase involved in cell wall biosynthesis
MKGCVASMPIKISILVPICNVERYLPKCLDSIIAQTLDDIEIVCINDGSKDNSLSIIQDYANKDNRIVVIDKPNSGYGDSMNKGLKIAKGEYIGIVESDDFTEVNMFADLYTTAQKNKVDIVRSKYYLYWEDKGDEKYLDYRFKFFDKVFIPNEQKTIYMLPPAIWSAIYKRDFLEQNDIHFLPTPGASYQDTAFFLKSLFCAHSMIFLNKYYLHYRQDNDSSSVKNCSLEKAAFVSKEYNEFYKFAQKQQDSFCKIEKIVNTKYLRTMLWNLYRVAKKDRIKYIENEYENFKDILINNTFIGLYFSAMEKAILWCIRTKNNEGLNFLFAIKDLKKNEGFTDAR